MLSRIAALAVALALALPALAQAADLTVSVTNLAGAPVADAVVMVRPASGTPPGPIRFAWPMVVEQRDMQFRPFVLVAPVGAEVAFPNRDPFRHHVYSFSPAKPFELKLYGTDEERSIRFDKPGVIALGCNIHDQMVAFIKVVDTPYAAKTNAAGAAIVRDLPPGGATLKLWRPYLRAPGNEITRAVTVGQGIESFSIELRPPPPMRSMY